MITLCEVTQTQKDRFHTVLPEAFDVLPAFDVSVCMCVGGNAGRHEARRGPQEGQKEF